MKTGYKFFILILFTTLILIPSQFAQEKLKDKLDKIDGSIDKITITSEGKEYLFEGNDAEELFKMIKRKSSHNFVWNTSDDDKSKKKVIILDSDGENEVIEITGEGDDDIIIKKHKDFDSDINGITKKVKVEVENGNKIVTVTTKENGEEKTDVYEGQEADEYIEKMKSENDDFDIIINKDSDDKKVEKIIIKTEKEEKNN
ncbi:MAG: hypothetical protein WBQ32_03100 [Ignavibacteriaceae bacterium]